MKIEDFIRGIIDEVMENIEIEGVVDINGDAYPVISRTTVDDIIKENTELLKEALTQGLLE